MRMKGFPEKFISWIKACICDVPFSVCINGALQGFFSSSAGLRQGCPLSPLLFAIVMDAFSCFLDSSSFLGIPLGSSSLKHLLYADDVLVFGLATIPNANELAQILDNFAMASGLHINNNKCSILFSKNLTIANDIMDILGFSAVDHTFKYLGLPISTKKLNSSHFQPLLSRISTLLAGWKVKFLSFAGRVQFLRFTIANTIAYWIRGAIIPKSCCKSIDRMCSRFLFHGDKEGKKLHLIAWKDTCLPTCFGGLGIPDLASLAHGFAGSFIWRFFNSSSLVFDWYRHRFTSPFKPAPHKCSKYWKFICGVANKLKGHLNITVNVDNCSKISFYWDPWLNGTSLADIVPFSSELLGPISMFWNSLWAVPEFLPLEVRHSIFATSVRENSCGSITWIGTEKPNFKVFRLNYFEGRQKVNWHHFIWHKRAALRFSSYSWLLIRGGLKLADILARRNIFIDANCPLCRLVVGSVDVGLTGDSLLNFLREIIPLRIILLLDGGFVGGVQTVRLGLAPPSFWLAVGYTAISCAAFGCMNILGLLRVHPAPLWCCSSLATRENVATFSLGTGLMSFLALMFVCPWAVSKAN
ncbi:uncharacterized protein LOC110110968 [Dendrobium catenatum]|uniref:uncharacterized protein LOC110110968 n=1 Tax=Dendrobium catenatum TaxID=906689 RepID=UPI0010A00546|nr:uncharacterized protein LOC110110968 [Dendrobium catenatum]